MFESLFEEEEKFGVVDVVGHSVGLWEVREARERGEAREGRRRQGGEFDR